MKKTILILTFVLLFSAAVSAQDFEYGKIEELKGLTKVFIDSGADMKSREMIMKEIEKAKIPSLEIVENLENAQIILVYIGKSEKVVQGATQVYNSTILNEATLSSGRGAVIIEAKGSDKKRPRLILSFENSQDTKIEKNPASKFGKEFVKAYKKANGIK